MAEMKTKHIVGIAAGGIIALLLTVGGIIYFVLSLIGSSDVCTTAFERAQSNPQVVAAIGTPITKGFLVSGKINTSGPSGNAQLAVPISGPKGSATIYLVAQKSAGQWAYSTLEVEVANNTPRIKLLPLQPEK